VRELSVRIALGAGVAGRVAATGEPIVVEDLSTVKVVSPRLAAQMSSTAAVPVRNENRVVGVLRVSTRAPRAFSSEHVRLLEIVADRMAGALARTRLFETERRAREEAERARVARDEVLSIVSHDLRNPVSTVAMSVALLRDPELNLSEAERRAQLDVIARSAERMNRLIRDLLEVARIEQGRLTIDCACHEPAALVEEAHDAFRAAAHEKSLTLQCHADGNLPSVYVDRDRIVQLLSNYLNNAVKFTPSGGRIEIAARAEPGRMVRLSVTDTGPGIADDELPHVFTRFWQARRTAHLGTGLGLAIAKGIASAHRGTVDVQSEVGHGSTFSVVLPFSSECA
jgi:signal transduction histidine kinase